MKYVQAVLFIFVSLGLVPKTIAQPAAATESNEKTIRTVEATMINAYYKGDIPTLDRLEADDFTVINESGEETKSEQLKGIRTRTPADMHLAFDVEHGKVRFFGPVAIVTGVYTVRSTQNASEPADHIVATEVWVQHGNEWKIEQMQYSDLKPDKP